MMLDMDTYQYETGKTAIYRNDTEYNAVNYTLAGLAGEAGECIGKWSKVIRDNDGELTYESRMDLAKELGDVFWFLARAADELGYCLSDIAMVNQHKLEGRAQRGTIGGSGDDR